MAPQGSGTAPPSRPGVDLGPVSAAGFAAYLAGERPPPEAVDDGTHVVAIPMPDGGIVTSTLCYVLSGPDRQAHLIDPGWNDDTGWSVLRTALDTWGLGPVATVVVTHLHVDHLGMAERVRQQWGARLVMSEAEWHTYLTQPDRAERDRRYDAWGVPVDRRPVMPDLNPSAQRPTALPDLLVHDGDRLDLGRPVEVMLTPGHTQGSITLRDDAHRLIVTGDSVLPHIHPGLGMDYDLEGDPLGDWLVSMERTATYDGYDTGPGHGFRFRRLARRIDQSTAHHLHRTRQVAAALADGPDDSVWQLASRLHWTRGFDNLEGYFLNSALQQTAMHRRFVRDAARSARWLATSD